MKIRIAVTLVVLGLLYTYIHRFLAIGNHMKTGTYMSFYLYYISQWQLITPGNGQKHLKTAEKWATFGTTYRSQMASESRDF